jgi:hypothetical protein
MNLYANNFLKTATQPTISSSILKKHALDNQKKEVSRFVEKLMNDYRRSLGTGRKKSEFPIKLWNSYDRVSTNLPRSNNSIEGWHKAFAKRVSIAHPTINKLTDKIRREQSTFEVDIAQIRQAKPKKVAYLKLE